MSTKDCPICGQIENAQKHVQKSPHLFLDSVTFLVSWNAICLSNPVNSVCALSIIHICSHSSISTTTVNQP